MKLKSINKRKFQIYPSFPKPFKNSKQHIYMSTCTHSTHIHTYICPHAH
ncbi:hypothetical protein LEMLEM_LOCUS1298, partial [Lemmus lemmus]